MEDTTFIILAGGASSRMKGVDKLLEKINGIPLISQVAQTAIEAKSGPVLVVLPPDKPARDAALKGLNIRRLHSSGSHYGMSHSLKLGLQATQTPRAMILLADMPEITVEDIRAILREITRTSAKIIRGAKGDKPGHPVLLDRTLFRNIETLSDDEGAQKILSQHRDQTMLVPLPGNHAICDLDTADDWAKWRTHHPDKQ